MLEDDVTPPPAKAHAKPKGNKKRTAPADEANSANLREGEAGPSYTRPRPKAKPKALKKTDASAAATTPDGSDTAGSTTQTPALDEPDAEDSANETAVGTPSAMSKKRKASTTAAAKGKRPDASQGMRKTRRW